MILALFHIFCLLIQQVQSSALVESGPANTLIGSSTQTSDLPCILVDKASRPLYNIRSGCLWNSIEKIAFPEWVNAKFTRFLRKKYFSDRKNEMSIVLARRILFLARTTWALQGELEAAGKKESAVISSLSRRRNNLNLVIPIAKYSFYPYAMAFTLGLANRKWVSEYLPGNVAREDKESNEKVQQLHDLVDVKNKFFSAEWTLMAFEVLQDLKTLQIFIPTALALIPFESSVFLSMGSEKLALLSPIESYSLDLANKKFHLKIVENKVMKVVRVIESANVSLETLMLQRNNFSVGNIMSKALDAAKNDLTNPINALTSEFETLSAAELPLKAVEKLEQLSDQTLAIHIQSSAISNKSILHDQLDFLLLIDRNSDFASGIFPAKLSLWVFAATFDLIDWTDVYETARNTFENSDIGKESALQTEAFINWFGDRHIESISKTLKLTSKDEPLDGARLFYQIDTLLYTLFQLEKEGFGGDEKFFTTLQILLSIHATSYNFYTNFLLDFLKLVPTGRPMWFAFSASQHAMTVKAAVNLRPEDGERLLDLQIFNTGDGIDLHYRPSSSPQRHYYSSAVYKNVPLALLTLDSIEAPFGDFDSETFESARPGEFPVWILYPDSRFRMINLEDPSDGEKDRIQRQHAGTCSARSLMAILKSELGSQYYQTLKLLTLKQMLKTYQKTFFNRSQEKQKIALVKLHKMVKSQLAKKLGRLSALYGEDDVVPQLLTKDLLNVKTKTEAWTKLVLNLNSHQGSSVDLMENIQSTKLLVRHKFHTIFAVEIKSAKELDAMQLVIKKPDNFVGTVAATISRGWVKMDLSSILMPGDKVKVDYKVKFGDQTFKGTLFFTINASEEASKNNNENLQVKSSLAMPASKGKSILDLLKTQLQYSLM